jgi:ADP-ribose pyrophosphatase YjhB (NUDIX family)
MLGDDWAWCPRCGNALGREERGGAPRPKCAHCGFLFFANMGLGAATAVRNAEGKVLLVQRGPDQFGAGRWCFPCGFVEWDEDVRAAAIRETEEEAGLVVILGEVLQVQNNRHEPDRPTVGVWFAATPADPSAVPSAGDDAVAAAWFDPASPPPLAFPTDVALLERLARER